MSTPCRLYSGELGWLTLSNILSPHAGQKWGVKKFSARFARKLCPPTFETVALPLYGATPYCNICTLPSHPDVCRLSVDPPR